MSLDSGEQAGVIWGGVATLLVLGGAVFKAAKLRGDTHNEWSARVALAVAALDEKTVAELRDLRDEIDALLPASDVPFDPAEAIIDPAPLTERAELSTKYYKARVRMETSLRRARSLGHALVAGLLAVVIGVVMLTAYYSEIINHVSALRPGGYAFAAVGVVIVVVAGAIYIHCQARLSGGEILAGTSGRAEAEDIR